MTIPRRAVWAILLAALCTFTPLSAQSDLDAFMQKVIARRDDNWKKFQQYVLDERELVEVRGPGKLPLWGERREYTWYLKDGFFVRSPVRFNGVTLKDEERRRYEERFLRAEQRREARAAAEKAKNKEPDIVAAEADVSLDAQGLIRQSREPQFISSAYFLKFKFEEGKYAFVGRERMDDREVLKIEHYPAMLFSKEQNSRQHRRNMDMKLKEDNYEAALEKMLNKVSLVTLWIEPTSHQIVKYEIDNVNLDFLPAAWLLRMTDAKASMVMHQPFPDVWLPKTVDMYFAVMLAVGELDIRHRITYDNYKLATATSRIKSMTAMRRTVLAVAIVLLPAGVAAAQGVSEVIAEIRVHGNHVTTTDEVIALAGVTVGAPFTQTTLRDVETRLRADGSFDEVRVLKRFASITDLSQIALVIIVNDGPVRVDFETAPDGEEVARVVRRGFFSKLMYLPILDGEDGYGLTYGLTTSLANVVGERSRLSVPLSWGGTKRAAVELEKNFDRGFFTRIEVGGAIERRRNPAFDIDDDREKLWLRAERAMGSWRLGTTTAWDRVTFGAIDDWFTTVGIDAALDTRLDPGYPRNAVWLSASWDRLAFQAGQALHRTRLDGRGYLGLVRESVLAVRVAREGASGAQPRYLQPLLGGWSSLRGFEAGRFSGDIVVTASAELFVPLTSPMSVGKFGVSAFVDSGVAYDHGLRFSDQPRHTGIGGSVWFTATGFKLSLGVAHGRGDKTRVNFGGGFTF
jgi:hypothetical protein